MIYKMITRKMIEKQPTEQQNFLWNMIGSAVYALSSMILSLFVIKIVGAEQGGVFSIALTLSQMLMYIAYFEMRNFQITDPKNEFTFSEYHATKVVLCLFMFLTSCGYVLIKDCDLNKAIVIILVCLSRLFDGYADVYEAQFQKDGRLDLAGKSLTYRTTFFVIALLLSLLITKDLVLALIIADIIAIVGILLFDVAVMKALRKIGCTWKVDKIKKIIVACFPLFIGVFCWSYILSASRIAIDGNMSSEYQSYYQVIFMPVSVVNLFAGFVFRPMLPRLAEDYNTKKYKKFVCLIGKGIIGIAAITAVCMLGAWLLGIPVLSVLSGCDLTQYKEILVFLIFAGGFNAVAVTMYYMLTIMRYNKGILVGYVCAAILAFCISQPMVVKHGVPGAAASYFAVVIILCLLFLVFIYKRMMENRKYTKKDE